MVQEMWWFNH